MAGPIFHASKLPLSLWFQAMYHLTQSKTGMSSVELARRVGVTQTTAWKVKHKLLQVMLELMLEREAETPLARRIDMDDAYLGGERSGGKRGRGSPGKTPLIAAVETTAEGKPVRVKLRRVTGFRRAEVEAFAQQSLIRPAPSSATGSTAAPPSPRWAAPTSRRWAAPTSRSSRAPAARRRAIPPSSGSIPCSATSRRRSPARTAPSVANMSRATSPNIPTVSIAAMISPP